jgi:hypothetical protein
MSAGVRITRDGVVAHTFHCGPLELTLHAPNSGLYDKVAETLYLYDFPWDSPYRPLDIWAQTSNVLEPPARGDFLRCARMLVDKTAQGLRATTISGARAIGTLEDTGERWDIFVPDSLVEEGRLEEIEDILSLVLTTGWRRGGWTPIHAAAVVKDGTCVIFCASTGGGKTTMTAAFVRRGWQVLGDDKLLLRVQEREPQVAALLHTFNLHPQTRDWFPEVGDLEQLPRYSVWTEKRKVSISSIWSHAPVHRARPSVLVSLRRDNLDVLIRPLEQPDVFATLLRQTVIPNDPVTARQIIADVAGAAEKTRGLQVDVPADAYRDPRILDALEEAIRRNP